MGLDRDSPVPLHLQLRALLVARIASGDLEAGGRLPSERQLCRQYDVSRTTVREALREMEREGVVRTVAGRATFVATPQSDLTVKVSLNGFSADIRRLGMTPSSILLRTQLIAAPAPDLVREMRLRPGDEVALLERLRLVNNVRLALHTVYLNHRLCPGILEQRIAEASLFGLLRDVYGLRLRRAEQRVYASLADQREMDLLNLTYPAAILRADRTTLLDTGEVVEYSLSAYHGDWYRLGMSLEPAD